MLPNTMIILLSVVVIVTISVPLVLFTVRSGDTVSVTEADLAAHEIDTANPHRVTQIQLGVSDPKVFDTGEAPEATDDARLKFSKGSLWVDHVNSSTYLCTDSTVDAANWVEISNEAALSAHTGNTSNPHGLTATTMGLGNVADVLHNLNASTAPTATDDAANGYGVFSRWVIPSTSEVYMSTQSDTGNAVWRPMHSVDIVSDFAVGANSNVFDFPRARLTVTSTTESGVIYRTNTVEMNNFFQKNGEFYDFGFNPNVTTLKYGFETADPTASFHFYSELTDRSILALISNGDAQIGFRNPTMEKVMGIDATDSSFAFADSNTLGTNNMLQFDGTDAQITGNLVAENVLTGAYTPSAANVSGFGSVTTYATHYSRCGNVVRMNVLLDVAYGSNADCFLELDVPIASNFGNVQDLVGVVQQQTHVAWDYLVVAANVTNDSLELYCNLTANSAVSDTLYLSVAYEVI